MDVDGTPLRVVHTAGKAGLTTFALEAGAHALRYYTDYFDQPYPGDKLDLVAIPRLRLRRDGEPSARDLP